MGALNLRHGGEAVEVGAGDEDGVCLRRINLRHKGDGVFRGINGPFQATRYHSLVVERDGLPAALTVNAETDEGLIMGVAHTSLPVHGVQFHPESIASEYGHLILKNFLDLAAAWNTKTGHRPARKVSAPRRAAH